MATAAVQNDKLNELLQCSVCMDVFTDPRTLPCLHTFCFKCIADWCKDKQPGSKVDCPECRLELAIPDSGINGLKKNFFIGNLLSVSEMNQKTSRMCEVCPGPKKKTSQKFCVQCQQSYCNSCSTSHLKIKQLSSHKLVTLDELKSHFDIHKKSQPIFCEKHTEEQIKMYCFEDKVAVCLMCCVLDHRSHQCEEIKKVADEFRVADKRKQDLQTAVDEVDENMRLLNLRKLILIDGIVNIETKICEKADKCIKFIESQKQNLITELHKIKTKCEQDIERLTHKLTQAKVQLTRFINYSSELLKEGSDVDICREESSLCNKTKDLVNMKKFTDALKHLNLINIVFSPSSVSFEECNKDILGHVKAEFIPKLACSVLAGENGILALALMNDELFVTLYEGKHVLVYNSATLQLKRSIRLPQLGTRPFGLAACSSSKLLFVSDFDKKCVHRVDLSKNTTSHWKVADRPLGLSMTNKQNVLVTSRLSPPSGKVQEYTRDGILVRTVSYDNTLWQALETKSDTLIVSHYGPSMLRGLVELSWSGQVLRCYSNQADCKQLYLSGSLCPSSKGNVFVGGSVNTRIQRIDSPLTPAGTVNINLVKPIAMWYDGSRGRLFVGEFSGQKRLMAFDHVSEFSALLK